MNVYFLLLACLQLVSTLTPVNPLTSWLPFLAIIFISACKEAIDDYYRYKTDKSANLRKVWVLSPENGKIQVHAEDINVGQLIYLEDGEEAPCDMVILKTSDFASQAVYIQTSNLDGETDVKIRSAVKETSRMTQCELSQFYGFIERASPSSEIYKFSGTLYFRNNPNKHDLQFKDSYYELDFNSVYLEYKNTIWKATSLKDTSWIIGVAVYTGNETKVGMNRGKSRLKFTKIDRLTNVAVIIIFLMNFIIVFIIGTAGILWTSHNKKIHWYLYEQDFSMRNLLSIPLRYFLLFSLMIPISLKVLIDLVKLICSFLINWDLDLVDQETEIGAHCNTTALVEDLGMIEYIFTDKTGTLTENCMILAQCLVNDKLFENLFESTSLDDDSPKKFFNKDLCDLLKDGDLNTHYLFRIMALCNTVIPEDDEKIKFKCTSMDEKALVEAAADNGYEFFCKKGNDVFLRIDPSKYTDCCDTSKESEGAPLKNRLYPARMESYTILSVLEFSSVRKCMSIVLRNHSNGEIIMISKGADEKILPMLGLSYKKYKNTNYIENFMSSKGYRVLCLAQKKLTEEAYTNWKSKLDEIRQHNNSEEVVTKIYSELENELEFVGAVGIEDKLQEGVADTIETLRNAGIQIWMLTGDKSFTSIEIATTCNLIGPRCKRNQDLFIIEDGPLEKVLYSFNGILTKVLSLSKGVGAMDTISSSLRRLAIDSNASIPCILINEKSEDKDEYITAETSMDIFLVVESGALSYLLQPAFQAIFLQLTLLFTTVICCRMMPNQKAQIVELVRHGTVKIDRDEILDMAEYPENAKFKNFLNNDSQLKFKYKKKTTLAVGDGSNDISMIKRADIGIGIIGKEGMQASRAADYRIKKFKHLKNLILVHGYWNHRRLAFVIQNCLYRSFSIAFMQFFYAFYSAFNGTTLFDSTSLTVYNFITSIPAVIYSFDKNIEKCDILLFSEIYYESQSNKFMNIYTLVHWIVRSFTQSAIIFFLTINLMNTLDNGYVVDYAGIGYLAYFSLIISQIVAIIFESGQITLLNCVLDTVAILLYIFGIFVLNFIVPNLYFLQLSLLKNWCFWFSILINVWAFMLPILIQKYIIFNYFPTRSQIVQQMQMTKDKKI